MGDGPISEARRRSLIRLAWRLDTSEGLLALAAVGVLIRLLIAPRVGFYHDLLDFRSWVARLRGVGIHDFYGNQFVDYPPGYLYVLWLIGQISAAPGYLVLKLPAIVGDLVLAGLAGTVARRTAPTRVSEHIPVRPVVVALVLFNPAVIGLSAGWGQVDVIPVVFVLSALLVLFTGPRSSPREIGAFGLFAVAVAMKPQSGFVIPIMLYALYRRHLHRRPRADLIGGLLRVAAPCLIALDLWFLSGIPFGLGPVELVRFYRDSASVYPVTSANAFNFWGILGFWRSDSTGSHAMTIAGISALHFGMLVFAVGAGVTVWRLHRAIESGAAEGHALMAASAIVSLLGFTFLTRMHERYMFLALACLAPLAFARRLRVVYVSLSALFLLNLWYPYTYFNAQYGAPQLRYHPWFNWLFGGFATDTWQRKVWSLAVTFVALTLAWRGLPWAREVDEPEGSTTVARVRRLPGALTSWTGERRTRVPGAARGEAAASLPSVRKWASASAALVGLTCVFGLVTLRGETTPAPNLNDSAFHLQMVRWADGQIREGRVPLDGWYPYLSLGSAQFHHYQSLPHTLTAYAARATDASDEHMYLWVQYILLALWPVAVFVGARLLGWESSTALAAAAVSPLIVSKPGYGYEHGSYVWRGYGVYSQLWAMWLLPVAWGLTWRAVIRGKRFAAATTALALTIACHFITGYLALLTLGVWVIVAGRGFLGRVGRAALVSGGSLVVASWVLVPLVGDTKWTNRSEFYKGTFFNDSYGAEKVLGWLFTGRLFDNSRFPVITLLFYAGVVVCLARARHDLRARALLGAFALSLLLFFGRPTLGPVLDLLPGFGDVQIHRFIMGVHLAGIFIAGVGLAWLFGVCHRAARRLVTQRYAAAVGAGTVLVAIALLAPAWIERSSYDRHGAELIRQQRIADATDGRDLEELVAIVKARGDGRVYAGLRGNWGRDFKVGYVPVSAWLADHDVDAIGFTFRTIASLSTDTEAAFDERNPAQYQMFNIRYVILPTGRRPGVPANIIAERGRYVLWGVKTTGYVQVVDRERPVAADRMDVEAKTRSFRESNLAARGVYPGIAFAGSAGPGPTFSGPTPPNRPAGAVISQSAVPRNGVFLATVHANRTATVLLKASYDPSWTATVDGRRAQTAMMAPSLVGVEVGKGTHVVLFRYRPYGGYAVLLAVGALVLLALLLVPRRAEVARWVRFRRDRALRERPSADPTG